MTTPEPEAEADAYVMATATLIRSQQEQIERLTADEQALRDFLQACGCGECHGTGETDNHVTGKVECSACEGSGHDASKAFARLKAQAEQIATLQAENARLLLERDSAKEQFDKHVEWASTEIARVGAQRDKWLDAFNRSEQFQTTNPALRAARAQAERGE